MRYLVLCMFLIGCGPSQEEIQQAELVRECEETKKQSEHLDKAKDLKGFPPFGAEITVCHIHPEYWACPCGQLKMLDKEK